MIRHQIEESLLGCSYGGGSGADLVFDDSYIASTWWNVVQDLVELMVVVFLLHAEIYIVNGNSTGIRLIL